MNTTAENTGVINTSATLNYYETSLPMYATLFNETLLPALDEDKHADGNYATNVALAVFLYDHALDLDESRDMFVVGDTSADFGEEFVDLHIVMRSRLANKLNFAMFNFSMRMDWFRNGPLMDNDPTKYLVAIIKCIHPDAEHLEFQPDNVYLLIQRIRARLKENDAPKRPNLRVISDA